MDVTNRESILQAKKLIEEKEGKLHLLVNKCVYPITSPPRQTLTLLLSTVPAPSVPAPAGSTTLKLQSTKTRKPSATPYSTIVPKVLMIGHGSTRSTPFPSIMSLPLFWDC